MPALNSRWWIENITLKTELTSQEHDAALELVGHEGMAALLGLLLGEKQALLLGLSQLNLGDESQRWQASVIQGKVHGIERARETLLELLVSDPTNEGE